VFGTAFSFSSPTTIFFTSKWYFSPVLAEFSLILRSQSYGGYGGGGGGYGGGYGGGGGGYGGGDDRMSNLGGGLRTIDWASTKIEHFEKNFYLEHKAVKERSEKDVEEFRRTKEIKVRAMRLPSVCPET
jgi:ATP-dependent RNA helicase DDX5/DBP2